MRAGIGALVLSAALLQAPPSAAEDVPVKMLTLKGDHGAYADFAVADSVTIVPGDSIIHTDGSYAGFTLYSLPDHKLKSGRTLIPAFEATGHPFGPLTHVLPQDLGPGMYRVYLFTDGATTIQIPLQGLSRPLRVRPKSPASVEAGVLDLAKYPLLLHGSARVSIDVGEPNWMYLVALETAPASAGSRMSVCAAPRGAIDCAVHGESPGGTALYPGVGVQSYALKFSQGSAASGPKDLLFSVDGAGIADSLLGFYVLVHTSPVAS